MATWDMRPHSGLKARRGCHMKVGLDVGSTTIKCVVLDDQNNIVYKSYERHLSQITEKMSELLTKVRDEVIHGTDAQITVSGSAGM